MKYVIINGSPRKKNTWKVVEQVKKSLNGEFIEVHLAKEKIPLCNGCYRCFDENESKCPHFDKIHQIMEKIEECDAIIITSPVYAMNVSGLIKNFFDHTAYLYHRPRLFTKKALVVVTTAGAGHKDVAKYIDETLRHWGVNKVYKLAMACGGKTMDTKKVDEVSKNFSKDVDSNKLHNPKLMDIIFFNVWRTLALGDNSMEADAEYWKSTGLVNCDFAPEVKLNIFKKIFSKILFQILKRVM